MRKAAVWAGKTQPAPDSAGGMRNAVWNELAEWQALDSIRSAAGGAVVPAAVIARELAPAQGPRPPVVDRLVIAATAFDAMSGRTPPPEPAVLAQVADDLRYAVMDVWSSQPLRPPLNPAKQQLMAKTAQVGDLLMLTAADSLRRAQQYPGEGHDLLTWEIRQLLGGLSTRPGPLTGELRQEWDKSDFLRTAMFTPPGQDQSVSVGAALEELDGFVRAGNRLSSWVRANQVLPMLLATRQRVLAEGSGIPLEEQAVVLADIDSVALAVEALLGPEIGVLAPSAADVRAARTARIAEQGTSSSPGLPPLTISAGDLLAARAALAAEQASSSAVTPGSPAPAAKKGGLPSAALMSWRRKNAVMAGKTPAVPGSRPDLRNKVWDDLQEWSALDSARSLAGGELLASTIAEDLIEQGMPSPDVVRLVSAAAAFDVVSARKPPDPAALARAADDLRYAVKDTRTAPELQPPLSPEKQRRIAKTAQVGDKVLLTAVDALRRAQVDPGSAADPLTSGIRDLVAELSTRPGSTAGALRQRWDKSDFLRTYTYQQTVGQPAVSVGAALGDLDSAVRAGDRNAIQWQTERVLPMLLAARQRVIAGGGIPLEERAKLHAEIDSAAIAVEGLMDPRIPPPKSTTPAASAPAAASGPPSGGALGVIGALGMTGGLPKGVGALGGSGPGGM